MGIDHISFTTIGYPHLWTSVSHLDSRQSDPTESLTRSSVLCNSLAQWSCLTQQSEPNQRFYGRRKEIELFDALLQSTRGTIVFRGEHGIGKTELIKQLVVRARTHQEHRIACAYVEAWPSMLATDPFVDVLTAVLDSFASFESTTEKVKDRLERLAKALTEEANTMVAAFLTDIADRVVGEQTVSTLKRVLARYKDMKSDIDSARSKLSKEPRSFIYVVNTVLTAIHRSNPDIKLVLVFDQFERVSESAWWILLDLIRGMPEQVYVLAAFRHQAEIIPKSLERFFLEGTRIEGFQVNELQGMETEQIGDWVQSERRVDLTLAELSRIRQNSGGFPILLAPWIRRSESLDPDELRGADLRRSVCEEVMRRITEQPLDMAVVRFLHQLSVLEFPLLIEADQTSYERLTGLDSMTISAYSELLERRWILDGNRERPWFRHELVRLCIEHNLRENERTKLHKEAASFYQQVLDEARESREAVPFAAWLACGYHFHESGEYGQSLHYNESLGRLAQEIGELDVADECYRRTIEAAQAIGDEGSLMRIKGNWAGILVTWGKLEESKAIYEKEVLPFFEKKNDEESVATVLTSMGQIEKDKSEYSEAERFFKRALEIREKLGDQKGVSGNLIDLSALARRRGNNSEAEALCKRALEVSTRIGDQECIAASLHQLGMITSTLGRYSEAEDMYKQALEIAVRELDKEGVASSLGELGNIAWRRSRYDEAERLYKQCLDIMETLGKLKGISACLCQLGIIAKERGDYFESEQLQKRSMEISRRLGDQEGISENLFQLGDIAQDQGNYREAERLFNQSLELRERIGDQEGVACSLGQLGLLLESMGRLSESKDRIFKALEIFTRTGNKPNQEQASFDLARVKDRLQAEGQLKSE